MKKTIILVLALMLTVSALAETPIETVTEWIDGGIGIGETVTSVTLEGGTLDITIDLGEYEELYEGYSVEFASDRASSITDAILENEDFDAEWDSIVIHFDGIGKIALSKEDIEYNDYGMRYLNVYDEDYQPRIEVE